MSVHSFFPASLFCTQKSFLVSACFLHQARWTIFVKPPRCVSPCRSFNTYFAKAQAMKHAVGSRKMNAVHMAPLSFFSPFWKTCQVGRTAASVAAAQLSRHKPFLRHTVNCASGAGCQYAAASGLWLTTAQAWCMPCGFGTQALLQGGWGARI